MMIKNLFTGIFSLLAFTGFTQDVLNDITNIACECIDGMELRSDQQSRNMQLGLCIIESAEPYKDQLYKEYGIDFNYIDGDSGRKLGELIGVRMATLCPNTLMRVSQSEEQANSGFVVGNIEELKTEQFNILVVTDEDGKKYNFLWLYEFDKSFELLEDTGSLKGAYVEIGYEQAELFDPRINEYRTFLIIREINF